MSGHNKWSKIKNVKAKTDAAKSRLFSKYSVDIAAAVRAGGGIDDPAKNSGLRVAIDAAKKINMPNDIIKRAVDRGAGRGGAGVLEDVTYEGYAPGGIALYIECLTDNRNRTASSVRSTLEKNGGTLGTPGSVGFLFNKKGYLEFDSTATTEEQLMDILIEAGAEDIKDNGDGTFSVYCEPTSLSACIAAAEKAKLNMLKAEQTMIPLNAVNLDETNAQKVLNLIDKLEEIDDVKNVSGNHEISDAIMEKLAAQAE